MLRKQVCSGQAISRRCTWGEVQMGKAVAVEDGMGWGRSSEMAGRIGGWIDVILLISGKKQHNAASRSHGILHASAHPSATGQHRPNYPYIT